MTGLAVHTLVKTSMEYGFDQCRVNTLKDRSNDILAAFKSIKL